MGSSLAAPAGLDYTVYNFLLVFFKNTVNE
jgi:hypothetical protein